MNAKTSIGRTRKLLASLIILGMASTLYGPAFMKIQGVDGESKDTNHDKWIDVLSIDWGMHNPVTTEPGTTRRQSLGVGFDEVSVTKWIDKSSPILMQSCAQGQFYADIEISFTRKAVQYLVITMQDVLVTSVSTGGSGGEDRLTENVTLNFARITWDYKKTADGEDAGVPPFQWDLGGSGPAAQSE